MAIGQIGAALQGFANGKMWRDDQEKRARDIEEDKSYREEMRADRAEQRRFDLEMRQMDRDIARSYGYGARSIDDPAAMSGARSPGKVKPWTGDPSDTGLRFMGDLMRDYGLTAEQAAGFTGNFSHESGDFQTLQEVAPMVPGSRGGWGYAQWTGPRRRAFEKWTSEQGLDPSSYEANYGFTRYELDNTSEGKILGRLRGAKTVQEAAELVSKGFLRPGIPNMGSRISRADAYLRGYGSRQAPAAPPPPAAPTQSSTSTGGLGFSPAAPKTRSIQQSPAEWIIGKIKV